MNKAVMKITNSPF